MPKFRIPKPKLTAKTPIAMGLAVFESTPLLTAACLELISNRIGAIRENHATLVEAVAIDSYAFIVKNEFKVMKLILGLVIDRNDDILSGALRHQRGNAIGEHEWVDGGGERSTDTHMKVPL